MVKLAKKDAYNIAVVGATGAVGQEMLKILEQRQFPVQSIVGMASARSAGKSLLFSGRKIEVQDIATASFEEIDIALFSAGSDVSKMYAPRAVEQGCIVIDNTSAFRMDDGVPLVVPEVNAGALETQQGIIANPNCSTIQMVVALKPLADAVGIERIVVSTYQSASGAGQKGIDELLQGTKAYIETRTEPEPNTFAHPLAFEVLPHIDTFFDNGFTREELKMVNETRKIMALPDVEIAATCVRVPVLRGHSESVTVDLKAKLSAEQAREIWHNAAGIKLYDNPQANQYPLSRQVAGTDPTWIGRIRQDLDRPQTLHFWVVSDNLRKGAALNAVQIAESLRERT